MSILTIFQNAFFFFVCESKKRTRSHFLHLSPPSILLYAFVWQAISEKGRQHFFTEVHFLGTCKGVGCEHAVKGKKKVQTRSREINDQ